MTEEPTIEILELGPFLVNCYIVADPVSKEGLIIDPSWDPELIISHVNRMSLNIKKIVITHGHADHIGALDEIRKTFRAPVLIGEKDAAMLTNPVSNLSGLAGEDIITTEPDGLLKEGHKITVGGYSFDVLETPGHSPGSISLHGHGAVFTGDALFLGSIGRTDFPGCSLEILIGSIRSKLLTLPDDTIVYPGHGPDTTIGQERQFNPFL
jgi:hydroxyacylglutathione hydrolase